MCWCDVLQRAAKAVLKRTVMKWTRGALARAFEAWHASALTTRAERVRLTKMLESCLGRWNASSKSSIFEVRGNRETFMWMWTALVWHSGCIEIWLLQSTAGLLCCVRSIG